ncbi:MAG: hypothetical protein C0490_05600, partial [Marivirga sp.]|nr:hypothetical protein [Marivirga sp.]
TKDSRWGIPLNMGPKINSAGSERFARLSPDGKYLFFGSTRNSSATNWGFDIYWIDAGVIDELRNDESAQRSIDDLHGGELIAALYKNDSKASAHLLKQWISSYPNSLDATVIYSSVLRKLKDYSEAGTLLANSPSQWKENTSIIMEKALVKFGVNRDDEAKELLDPILTPGDQVRERYLYLSASLLDMGKFKISDAYFGKAMAISAGSYPYYNRARAYTRLGEKDKAFDVLKKALDFGNNTRKDLEDDPELQSLKSDARWKMLMETLK